MEETFIEEEVEVSDGEDNLVGSPDISAGGSKSRIGSIMMDEEEKEKISIEVVKLEKKISELKLKLNLGEKTNYKDQKKREV